MKTSIIVIDLYFDGSMAHRSLDEASMEKKSHVDDTGSFDRHALSGMSSFERRNATSWPPRQMSSRRIQEAAVGPSRRRAATGTFAAQQIIPSGDTRRCVVWPARVVLCLHTAVAWGGGRSPACPVDISTAAQRRLQHGWPDDIVPATETPAVGAGRRGCPHRHCRRRRCNGRRPYRNRTAIKPRSWMPAQGPWAEVQTAIKPQSAGL